MRLCKNRDHCYRTVLQIITTTACISIVICIILKFTSDREKSIKTEISKESSFHSEKQTDEKCIPVCKSRNCIKQADILLRTINPSNDPCENFQKFLCGTYEQNIGLYENGSIVGDMTERMMNKLKNIIENIEAKPGSGAEKMKIMYDSCVNSGSSDLRGVEHFREFLENVEIYNWPYLSADFKFSDFGLSKLLGTFRAYNEIKYMILHIASMDEDEGNPNEKFVKIYFHDETMFNDTPAIQRGAATDILSYFADESEDVVEILLNDYYGVRAALLSFKEEFSTYDDPCKENCSDIWIDCSKAENDEWEYVCETVKTFLNITNLKQYVTKNEIAVYSFHYVKNLIPRLKSLPDRSVANYFALNLLWNHLDEVNFFFRRKTQKHFNYFKTEKKENQPNSNRWEYCVTWITSNMKIVLENELVKTYLTRSHVDELHDFHQSFNSAVKKMIDQQEWLEEMPKMFLKQKVENLECNMMFLQQLLPNDTYVNKFLKMFNPKQTNFFYNVLDYWRSLMHAYNIQEEYKHDGHVEPEFQVGAMTDKETNIVLHYGFLMPPIYYPGHEKFINMIHLAPVYGHEIGHNMNLFLEMFSVSSDTIKDAVVERMSCIENQFSMFKFLILDENLNGTQYMEENLSDNLGYAIADKMINEIKFSEDAFLLPGLPYTLRQLLHMSSRLMFCSKFTREVEIFLQANDTHSPNEYRIIGTAQNSKGYSQAFGCPEGSYMNPREKCSLFDSV